MISRQQTHDLTSNVSLNRQKNISLPQKPSIENVVSKEEFQDSKQAPMPLPNSVNQFGQNYDNYPNHNQYASHNNSNSTFFLI